LANIRNTINKPIVSVVVAVKNGAVNLQRCIDSCTNQTCPHFEIVIMDGGSDDGTIDIIRSNADRIAYWESRSDRGIAHAWNRSLRHTTGEWIIFLGSDDYFSNSSVLDHFSKKIADHLLENGRVIYGMIRLFFPGGDFFDTQGTDWNIVRSVFLSEKMMIPHPACFHHCSVFKEFGTFDEEFFIAVDYEFLLRILKAEDAVFLHDFIVTNMALGGLSSRTSTLLIQQKECDRALIKHGYKPKGYKRTCNIIIYRLLGVLTRVCGEQNIAKILDIIRIFLGKKPVWTRK